MTSLTSLWSRVEALQTGRARGRQSREQEVSKRTKLILFNFYMLQTQFNYFEHIL